jgi:hypothetical protein
MEKSKPKRKASTKNVTVQKTKIGFWKMARDVLVASLNKGQFPFAMMGVVSLALIWRMPKQDLSKLVFELLESAKSGAILGWLLFAVAILGWFLHARAARAAFTREMNRITGERNRYQSQAMGASLQSSDNQ